MVVVHCTASVFVNQVGRNEPAEGTVWWVVHRSKIRYAGPKTFQSNVPQDVTKTIDTCLVQTVLRRPEVFSTRKVQGVYVCLMKMSRIRRIFVCSPRKSTRAAGLELQVPHSTVHRGLRKPLCLYDYKLQVVQTIKPDDRVACKKFSVTRNWKKTTNSWGKSYSLTRLHSTFQDVASGD
jgi:hypothetical protein